MAAPAAYAGIERKVERWHRKWKKRLGLEHWEIELLFMDSLSGLEDQADDFLITGTTEVRWNYFEARIKYYLPRCVQKTDEALERTVLHELVHVLLSAEQSELTTAKACEKQELSTELVTIVIWNAYV